MIADTTIQEVKSVPIIEVVSHYVNLKRKGSNYLGACPFHNEKTPSFYVSPARNSFKCFGCGIGGDAIKFVTEYEQKNFIEAVEIIAGIMNIPIQTEEGTKRTKRTSITRRPPVKQITEFDTIPSSLITPGNNKVYSNPLTALFANVFGPDIVAEAVANYSVTINDNWLTFPQIDQRGKYRTGKAIKYKNDGHRDSEVLPIWIHGRLTKKGLLPESFKLKQCFTGEDLIKRNPDKTIAIVEGQSTMLFMSCLSLAAQRYQIQSLKYFTQFLWLSTGGSDGIGWKGELVTDVLKNRDVILFPDAGFYSQWLMDAEIMQEIGLSVTVSNLLEKKYTQGEIKKNEDLRDYFQQYSEEIKSLCNIIEFDLQDIEAIPCDTRTGLDFDSLIIATAWLKDGRKYDILFDRYGEFTTENNKIESLSNFFNKSFIPARIDGKECLIHNLN